MVRAGHFGWDLRTWRGSACSPRHATVPAPSEASSTAARVGEVLDAAVARYGTRLAAVIAFSAIWLNGEPASRETPVGDSDEVAVLPPVSGG